VANSSVFQYLCALPPAKVDQEFRLLCLHDQDVQGLLLLKYLMELLKDHDTLHFNFDIVQSFLYRLLCLHGSKLPVSFSLDQTVLAVQGEINLSVAQLQLLVHTILSLLRASLNIQLI
jgi:hypothetical protein